MVDRDVRHVFCGPLGQIPEVEIDHDGIEGFVAIPAAARDAVAQKLGDQLMSFLLQPPQPR